MRAKQELRDLLAGDQIAIDVVGYIAGSGGGLTRSDLSALTGAPPLKLDPVLRGVSGRSLADARAPRIPATPGPIRRRGCTCSRMRPCGSPPRNNSAASWPATGKGSTTGSAPTPAAAGPTPRRATPSGATRGLLTATSDATRLSALARDPRRHAFLLRATGSDYAALAEIRTAQGLLAGQKVPGPAGSGGAGRLPARHLHPQPVHPGRPARRVGTARSFRSCRGPGPHHHRPQRPGAGAHRAGPAAAQAGDLDRAEALARTITRLLRPRRGRSPSWPARPPRPATWTAPRPWPAPSPTPMPRRRLLTVLGAAAQAGDRGPRRSADRPTPRPWPAPSPTPCPGAGAHRAGRRPGRRPGPRVPAGRRRRGPGPHHHRPDDQAQALTGAGQRGRPGRRPGPRRGPWPAPSPTPTPRRRRSAELARAAAQAWRPGPRRGPGPRHHRPRRPGAGAHRAGRRGRPGWRPGPRRGPGPRHHRSRLPGTGRSPRWPPPSPGPATWTAPRPWPAPSPTPPTRPGRSPRWPRGRPGRGPGARRSAGGRRRGPGPRHHQP